MRRSLCLVGLCLISLLAVSGCGGGSSSSQSPNQVFAGSYVGSFTGTDTGEFAINITSSGAITGRFIDKTRGISEPVTSGQITLTTSSPTTDTGAVTATSDGTTVVGTFTLTSGVLTGSITNGAITYQFTSGLVSTAGDNSFAGFYAGTFTFNGNAGSPANELALIVDGNGNVTGLDQNNSPGGTSGLLTGTIVTSTGVTSIGPSGGTPSTGTLHLSSGVLSGTLSNNTATIVVSVHQNE